MNTNPVSKLFTPFVTPLPVAPILFLSLLLLSFAGCKDEQTRKIEELQRQILELSQSAARSAKNLDLSQPIDEVKKLSQIEYGVFSFPIEKTNEQLAEELNRLGEQRWDCFSLQREERESEKKLTAYCKRRPEGVLRFIHPSIAGGLLGLLH